MSYDVTAVPGAKGALVEISAPTPDFFKGLFITGTLPLVNNFTNPYGDRLDTGNAVGQLGSVFHKSVSDPSGTVKLNGRSIGLTIPTGACDSSYQVRVFATDSRGKIIGVASNPSVLSYADLSTAPCNP